VADVIVEQQSAVGHQPSVTPEASAHPATGNRAAVSAACCSAMAAEFRLNAVIVTTGTFLNGLIHCGEQQYPAGRSGEPAAVLLGEALKRAGAARMPAEDGNTPAPRRTND
jgi:tRNA uridine 5-carboxymethylaminomethyl modification enzyme